MLTLKLLKLFTKTYQYLLTKAEKKLTKHETKAYKEHSNAMEAGDAQIQMAESMKRRAEIAQAEADGVLIDKVKKLNAASNFISNAKSGLNINQYL